MLTKIRASVYELLAGVYLREPDHETLTACQQLAGEMIAAGILSEDLALPVIVDLEGLKQEYYDRFYVTVSDKYVPPFESAIVSAEINDKAVSYGLLNGSVTSHVLECYRTVGFNPWELEIFEPLKEVPLADFLGFELAFMAYLSYAELRLEDEIKKGEWFELQRDFLSQHLTQWCETYASLANKKADDFYGKIVELTAAWVSADFEMCSHNLKKGM